MDLSGSASLRNRNSHLLHSSDQLYRDVATIQDGPSDANSDAAAIRRAISGCCCKDMKGIVHILCKRTDSQRIEIVAAYKSNFSRHLSLDLKSMATGNFQKILVALATPKFDYLAQLIRRATKGLGTNEALLIDIICTATPLETRAIHEAYGRIYNQPMERDIAEDTSFHFRRLLNSICTSRRSEDHAVDYNSAVQDAQTLLAAGIKRLGTNEAMFHSILATRSYAHLRAVFHEYEKLGHESIEKSIKSEFSGDVKAGLLAVVKCAKNRAAYFAERTHDAIKGLGTNEELLILIMVTRCDIDMENIKNEYQRLFKMKLAKAIDDDTSGFFKDALLILINDTP